MGRRFFHKHTFCSLSIPIFLWHSATVFYSLLVDGIVRGTIYPVTMHTITYNHRNPTLSHKFIRTRVPVPYTRARSQIVAPLSLSRINRSSLPGGMEHTHTYIYVYLNLLNVCDRFVAYCLVLSQQHHCSWLDYPSPPPIIAFLTIYESIRACGGSISSVFSFFLLTLRL
jgi:hypothetical protein